MKKRIIAIALIFSLALAFSPIYAESDDEGGGQPPDAIAEEEQNGEEVDETIEESTGETEDEEQEVYGEEEAEEIEETEEEQQDSQEEVEENEEEEDLVYQDAAAAFSDAQDIQSAIDTADPGDTIVIPADVELDVMLTVNKSLTFAGDGAVQLIAKYDRHMQIIGNDITVSFSDVTLFGDETGGGIRISGNNIRLVGAVVTKCHNDTIKTGDNRGYIDAGGAVYIEMGSDVTIDGGSFTYNFCVGVGGAVFLQDNATVTFVGEPVVSYNEVNTGTLIFTTPVTDVSRGGAVCGIGAGSNIIINSGTFTYNKSMIWGGAICSSGKVVINGGNIDNNTVENTTSPDNMYGGGVYAKWIVMNGGSVSNNVVAGNGRLSMGGGGFCSRTTSSIDGTSILNVDDTEYGVDINGGIVSGNKVSPTDGGRYAQGGGIDGYRVVITGGEISRNTAETAPSTSRGGGVNINRPFGVFIMTGGTVSGNSAQIGGGVYMECPTTHADGTIYGISRIGGTAVIKNNTATTTGGGIAYYSEMLNQTFNAVIGGQALITENSAPSGGGITMFTNVQDATQTHYPPMHLTIEDDAVISFNHATTGTGGGIYANMNRTKAPASAPNKLGDFFSVTMKGNAKVNNNTAATYGGGIRGAYAKIFLRDNAQVCGNSANGYGGGICADQSLVDASGNASISDNTSLTNGGGIFLTAAGVNAPDSAINMSGNVLITRNESVGTDSNPAGGGGIATPDIYRIIIGENVVFEDNRARIAYQMTDETHIELHNTNILTTHFTSPFIYAFNNYDIFYNVGDILQLSTVTFETNGGTAVTRTNVITGTKVKEPVTTRSGYDFDGWYRDSEFKVLWNFENDIVDEDITLYAKWVLKPEPEDPDPDPEDPDPDPDDPDPDKPDPEQPKPDEPEPISGTDKTGGTAANTGDDSGLMTFISLLSISIVVCAGIIKTVNKKRKQNRDNII